MDDVSMHDAIAVICLMIVFNMWCQFVATILIICLFVSLARSTAILRLLLDGL